jgi:hypothetical protein
VIVEPVDEVSRRCVVEVSEPTLQHLIDDVSGA